MVALNSAEQVWLVSRPASSSIPTTCGAGTVEMRVQRPFERAGSGSHIAQTTKAGGCPTGSSRSVRRFARVTVKGYAANGLVRGHEKAAIVAVI